MQNVPLTDSSLRQLLDELRNSFEATRPDGAAPGLEEIVRSAPEPGRPELFRQLLRIEIERRAATQRPLALAEAINRFQPLGPWAEPIVRELLSATESWGPTRAGAGAAPAPQAADRECVGQYELLAKLGSGAYGAVYKARHAQLKSLVALKVLIPHRVLAPGGIERFFREMEILGRLSHPNIVRATDAGEARGYYFLAMELVEGLDLGHVLRTVSRLPVPAACEAVRQAADALTFIDAQQMVHRDVKPGNLLLGRDGVVRVLDLGLAQLSDVPPWEQLTETGAVMGTPEYMSPEQTRESRDVNIRSDVYGLGCTFFALLTGAPPFTRGGSVYDLFRAHNESRPPSITATRPEVPAELEQLIHQMLEKDPARRPTPEAVAQALIPFCAGADLRGLVADCGPRTESPVDLPTAHTRLAFGSTGTNHPHATTVSFAPPPAPPRPTRRQILAAVAVALVLSGIALAVWSARRDKSHEEGPPGEVPVAQPVPEPAPLPHAKHPPRAFKPGEWTEVLDRPPVKRIWPAKNPLAQFTYDEEHRHLHVNCPDGGALELADIEADAFDVQAVIFQNAWSTGRVGVFFRGRSPPAPSTFSWRAEKVFLRSLDDPRAGGATLARGSLGQLVNGGNRFEERLLYDVPRPVSGDYTLSFSVSPAGTTNLKWGGADAIPRAVPPTQGEPPRGGLGVIVQDSGAVFRSVRVRVHNP